METELASNLSVHQGPVKGVGNIRVLALQKLVRLVP